MIPSGIAARFRSDRYTELTIQGPLKRTRDASGASVDIPGFELKLRGGVLDVREGKSADKIIAHIKSTEHFKAGEIYQVTNKPEVAKAQESTSTTPGDEVPTGENLGGLTAIDSVESPNDARGFFVSSGIEAKAVKKLKSLEDLVAFARTELKAFFPNLKSE